MSNFMLPSIVYFLNISSLIIKSVGSEREGGERVLLSVTRSFVVSDRRSFLLLWVLWKGCVLLLWHSLGLPLHTSILPVYLRHFDTVKL